MGSIFVHLGSGHGSLILLPIQVTIFWFILLHIWTSYRAQSLKCYQSVYTLKSPSHICPLPLGSSSPGSLLSPLLCILPDMRLLHASTFVLPPSPCSLTVCRGDRGDPRSLLLLFPEWIMLRCKRLLLMGGTAFILQEWLCRLVTLCRSSACQQACFE